MNPVETLRERQQVSEAFREGHRKGRIVHALAVLVRDRGYDAVTVADIVRRAGIARNTFYETFDGKASAAVELFETEFPPLSAPLLESGVGVYAVEVAAYFHLNEDLGGDRAALRSLKETLTLNVPSPGEELLRTLPPGRHGLPSSYIDENQRTRLLIGFSAAVLDKGYPQTTIADITRHAAVSRRTFYEFFQHRGEVALAVLEEAGATICARRLFPLAVEVVASWLAQKPSVGRDLLADADNVLDAATLAEDPA